MTDRKAEGTCGRRGRRVCSSLKCQRGSKNAGKDLLDRVNDILVPQHDQVPDNGTSYLPGHSSSTHQEAFQLSRQFLRLLGVTLRNLTDEGDQVREQLVIFILTVLSR